MYRVLFAVPVFVLTAGGIKAQNDPPDSRLWEHTFPSDIDYSEVTALGTVLVITGDEIATLDPGTGEVILHQ